MNSYIEQNLKIHEKVVIESQPSKTGLLITWLSIPGAMLIIFLFTYLPQILSFAFNAALRSQVFEELGIDNPMSYAFNQIFGFLPPFIFGLIVFILIMLVSAWLIYCLVLTYRHFSYALAVTDSRVIGKAGREELDSPLKEVVNVFVEQSLWGKLGNYGSVVVSTKRKSLTFRGIHNPYAIHKLLMSYASNYCAQ